MPKVNYLVACWGVGRTTNNVPAAECMGYLLAHRALLSELKHDLDQITVIHPYGPITKEYEGLLEEIDGQEWGGAKVAVIRRPNENRSYGSWSDAFDHYRTSFDYYIIMEDDWVPFCDGFDSILVDIIERKEADYVCAMMSTTSVKDGLPHAGVTVGICRATAMQKIWDAYGSLLSDDFADWYWHNQMNWSYPYVYQNLKMVDYADEYGVPFWYAQKNEIKMFVDHGPSKHLLVPIQYYRGHVKNV